MTENCNDFAKRWSADCLLAEQAEFLEHQTTTTLLNDLPLTDTLSNWQRRMNSAYCRGFHHAITEYDRMKAEWEQRQALANGDDNPAAGAAERR